MLFGVVLGCDFNYDIVWIIYLRGIFFNFGGKFFFLK